MKNQKPASAEYQKLQAAWKKAARIGELVVPCQSLSDARRLRFTLYNAVKDVREGKVHEPALLEAVRSVSLQVRDNPPCLVMQERSRSSALSALSAVLEDEDLEGEASSPPVMSPEEAESLARMQTLLSEPVEEPVRANPYYTRER